MRPPPVSTLTSSTFLSAAPGSLVLANGPGLVLSVEHQPAGVVVDYRPRGPVIAYHHLGSVLVKEGQGVRDGIALATVGQGGQAGATGLQWAIVPPEALQAKKAALVSGVGLAFLGALLAGAAAWVARPRR